MGTTFATDPRLLVVEEHDLEWWLEFSRDQKWAFARTMPDYPHSYVVRQKTLPEVDYVRAFGVVRTFGQPAMFNGRTQVYLHDLEDDRRWWPMSRHHWQSRILNHSTDGKLYGPQTAPLTVAPTFTSYDRIAAYYDDVYRTLEDSDLQAFWKSVITATSGSRLSTLDLGAGTGGTIDTRAVRAADTVVVDPSQGMLNDLVVKHPTVKQVHAITAEEYLAWELGQTFDVVTASFGSASYFEPDIIEELPYLAKQAVVLSFYAPRIVQPIYQDGALSGNFPSATAVPALEAALKVGRPEHRGQYVNVTIEGKAGRG